MSSSKVSFIINTINYFLINWRNEDRNPVNTKNIVFWKSPFFAVCTQTELKSRWFPLNIECCWRTTELTSYNCCAGEWSMAKNQMLQMLLQGLHPSPSKFKNKLSVWIPRYRVLVEAQISKLISTNCKWQWQICLI